MPTLINPSIQREYSYSQSRTSLLKRFFTWSANQQENRLLWLGLALAGHGCALTPITIYFVLLAGLNFTLFMIALGAMAMALVVNLAALPTKITVPVLALTVLIDIAVIAYSLII